jgi:hypothetical protein
MGRVIHFFLSLKNLVLSYDLPLNIIRTLKMEKMRVYVSASNLFTWTKKDYRGLDPERSNGAGERGGIPQAMTVKMGIDLNSGLSLQGYVLQARLNHILSLNHADHLPLKRSFYLDMEMPYDKVILEYYESTSF